MRKLIGGRYSLFDYVVRAAVKACASEPEWLAGDAAAELLMVLDKGEKYVFIENASGKTIYNIAMERLAAPAAGPLPAGSVAPNILLCDSGVNVAAQRAVLPEMPHSIISIGGTTPKTGIEAGRPVSKLILPVTLYVNAGILPECKASNIAAEFKTLLETRFFSSCRGTGTCCSFLERSSSSPCLTNHEKVAILAAPGFEEIELMAPLDILRRLNMDVVLAGVQSDKVVSTHEVTVSTDTMLDKLHADKLDALILPGGAGSWVLRDTPEVIHLVKKMHEAGKLVAAICAAPIVLAKAGLVRDRNVTAYPAQDVYRELNEAGAHIVKDENVVLDGNMLTANGPGAAMLFGYSIGEYLGEDLQVAQLKEQMCYTGL